MKYIRKSFTEFLIELSGITVDETSFQVYNDK